MSVVDHIGRVFSVPCAECGEHIRRRDAFVMDRLAFCCVLHEVEHFVRSV